MKDMKPGDLVAVSGKGLVSNIIQAGTVSLPNIGPLGRWGLAGISHVGIVVPVFGELLVYESYESASRPSCVRAGVQKTGVQAHFLSTILDGGGDVWHYPLKRALYDHEEDRLLQVAEELRVGEYDYLGAGLAWGGMVRWAVRLLVAKEDISKLFCSEFVAHLWGTVGILNSPNASAWNPARLCRHAVRTGICHKGKLVS